MNDAPRLARRRDNRDTRWRVLLVVGGFGLAAVVLLGLWLDSDFNAFVSGRAPQATAVVRAVNTPIIYAGMGTQTTAPFYLAGGTYRAQWSAWERAPEWPPCTHSIELMAVDPANATASGGHVTDLAKLVHVPATGASDESYVINVKAGDYYLDVDSACGWQVAITPN
jgi:hypothetical protein